MGAVVEAVLDRAGGSSRGGGLGRCRALAGMATAVGVASNRGDDGDRWGGCRCDLGRAPWSVGGVGAAVAAASGSATLALDGASRVLAVHFCVLNRRLRLWW